MKLLLHEIGLASPGQKKRKTTFRLQNAQTIANDHNPQSATIHHPSPSLRTSSFTSPRVSVIAKTFAILLESISVILSPLGQHQQVDHPAFQELGVAVNVDNLKVEPTDILDHLWY
jgi:hypothetical protein